MPKARDLEPFRDEITNLHSTGATNTTLLSRVNELFAERNEKPVSLATLKRHMNAWGLTRVRANVSLSNFYEEISEFFVQGLTVARILQETNRLLQQNKLPTIAQRTLESQLSDWGLSRHQRTHVTDELVERIRFYFENYGYSDAVILREIQNNDHLPVTMWAIRRTRWKHGMMRRIRMEHGHYYPSDEE